MAEKPGHEKEVDADRQGSSSPGRHHQPEQQIAKERSESLDDQGESSTASTSEGGGGDEKQTRKRELLRLARSERKRCREKQRRSNVNRGFDDLQSLLLKIEPPPSSSTASRDSSPKSTPGDATSNGVGGGGPGSTSAPTNRVDLIARTVKVLDMLHRDNQEMKRRLQQMDNGGTTQASAMGHAGGGNATVLVPVMIPCDGMDSLPSSYDGTVPIPFSELPRGTVYPLSQYHIGSGNAPPPPLSPDQQGSSHVGMGMPNHRSRSGDKTLYVNNNCRQNRYAPMASAENYTFAPPPPPPPTTRHPCPQPPCHPLPSPRPPKQTSSPKQRSPSSPSRGDSKKQVVATEENLISFASVAYLKVSNVFTIGHTHKSAKSTFAAFHGSSLWCVSCVQGNSYGNLILPRSVSFFPKQRCVSPIPDHLPQSFRVKMFTLPCRIHGSSSCYRILATVEFRVYVRYRFRESEKSEIRSPKGVVKFQAQEVSIFFVSEAADILSRSYINANTEKQLVPIHIGGRRIRMRQLRPGAGSTVARSARKLLVMR